MASVPTEVPARSVPARPLTMRNSGWVFAAFLVVTLFAFWPSYFAKLPARVDVYTHAHAALMTVWFGLLIAQPFLIRRDLRGIHRFLGRFSYLLVPAITVTWVQLSHARARAMPEEVFAREGKFFYLPFVSAVLFLVPYGMAVARRRIAPLHARYMVCTALALIDAVAFRLLFFRFPPLGHPLMYQVIGFGVTELILLALVLLDRGPYRRAFVHMLVLFATLHALWFTFGQTNAWLEMVRWFRGLPLT
jgi:hypothetical protein